MATLMPVNPTETDSATFMRSKSLDSGVTECCWSSEETTDLNPAGGERVKEDEELGRRLTPSERVARLLRQADSHLGHLQHPLFTEMETLVYNDELRDYEWIEQARFVKFEEDVENGGNRWSKPHVASLGLSYTFHLRCILADGVMMLDLKAKTLGDIADRCIEAAVARGLIAEDENGLEQFLRDVIVKRHRHQYEGNHPLRTKGHQKAACLNFKMLNSLRSNGGGGGDYKEGREDKDDEDVEEFHGNNHFRKKIPKNSEGSTVMLGGIPNLRHTLSFFVRLDEASSLGDLTEVTVPTKFIYLLFYPNDSSATPYQEMGRAMSTLLTDEAFGATAYRASEASELMAAFDVFLLDSTVLPPGEWDPDIRIDPPENVNVKRTDSDRSCSDCSGDGKDVLDRALSKKERESEDAGLFKSWRPFEGLLGDLKRKRGWYLSDLRDGLNLQCLAAFFFMYFAVLAPTIAFGGLLGEVTHSQIGVMEALIGSALVGMVYAALSGQPLSIMGITGPTALFEGLVYFVTSQYDLEHLPFRLWVGLWMSVILVTVCVFNGSYLVVFITRFTEELFASFIAVIFIIGAFQKIYAVGVKFPISPSREALTTTAAVSTPADYAVHLVERTDGRGGWECSFERGAATGTAESEVNDDPMRMRTLPCTYEPNVFLMSLLLFFATFLIAVRLKKFKDAPMFNAVRKTVSDFAVPLALLATTLTDYFVGVPTPKLQVPAQIQTTVPGRPWIVPFFGMGGDGSGDGNPAWSAALAFAVAVLGAILIFMDHQITQVIVNRKENKLEKGSGYHLDLLVVSVMVAVCSFLGLPWCEGSTVPAINHVKSLTKESEEAAPGEKRRFLGVREQRVTHLCVFLCLGLSAAAASVLRFIPHPVILGVFLYMGVASLRGLQFVDRICFLLVPRKHRPDLKYLRSVPSSTVRRYTLFQAACLLFLLGTNFVNNYVTMALPLTLVFVVLARKCMIPRFVDIRHVLLLDDPVPDFFKRNKDGDDKSGIALEGANGAKDAVDAETAPSSSSSSSSSSSAASFNVTEVIEKSDLWKFVKESRARTMSSVQNEKKDAENGLTLKID